MARRIIWAEEAQKDRRQIFSYWNKRNKSNAYSKKLNRQLNKTLIVLCEFPFIGRPTQKQNVRIKIVRDYLVIYKITNNKIIVLRIWDSRQNPQKLKL